MAVTLSKVPATTHYLNFDSHDRMFLDLDDFNPTEFNRCITTESNYNNLKDQRISKAYIAGREFIPEIQALSIF